MKKTLTINISGIIFHIDEDAFEQLNAYITSIKNHFSDEDGRDEIIADIESRIAELLQTKIDESKQVITLVDIQEVIKMMGQPFEMDNEEAGDQQSKTKESHIRYRRLYRDPDRKIIAGVCSGIAAYLKTDPLIIRILFLVAFLASGVGLLVYIIMWIALPEALTTADKLHMHGKPINIETIEKSIKAEFETVKTKFNQYAEDAKVGFEKQKYHTKKTADKIVEILFRIIMVFARILGIIIGIVLLAMGVGLVISFGALFLGWESFSFIDGSDSIYFSFADFFSWLLASQMAVSTAPVMLTLFIGIPLVMLIYLSLRLIIGRQFRIPNFGSSLGMLWVVSLIGIIFIVIDTVVDFKNRSSLDFTTEIVASGPGQVLHIKAEEIMKNNKLPTLNIFDNKFKVEYSPQGDRLYAYPRLNISRTTDELIRISAIHMASGYSPEEAAMRAETIQYNISASDSLLMLPSYYHFMASDKLRSQEVRISIKLSEGQIVYFDENMKELLHNNPHRYWRGLDFAGEYWIMTDRGLKAYQAN